MSGAMGLIVGGIAFLGALGAGTTIGWQLRDGQAWRDLGRTQAATSATTEKQAAATAQAETVHAIEGERIRTVFRTLTREVPVHVTPETAARFPLPVGFVRMHDAAAKGLDVSAVPDPAGRADDQASAVAADDGIGVVLDNYERCHGYYATAVGLQGWVAEQQAIDQAGRAP